MSYAECVSPGVGLSSVERQRFFREFASYVAAGIPVYQALDTMASTSATKTRHAARFLRDQLLHGFSVYKSMQLAGPRYFAEHSAAALKAKEEHQDILAGLQEAIRLEEELGAEDMCADVRAKQE